MRISDAPRAREDNQYAEQGNELGVSDSVLSKHVSQLVDARYVRLRKQAVNGRQRTWARLSPKGRRAFASHVLALQELASIASGRDGDE